MALFLDGAVSTTGDLTAQDSQLLGVASTEGIDLGSKLALAQEELGVELRALLNRASPWDPFCWPAPAYIDHMGIRHVVVTPPLKMWHTFRTLEMVYRDAYNNELNDRYAGKRDAFHEMAAWAREKLILLGIGMVWKPVPRAETPGVAPAQGSLAAGTYYVTMAWVNSAGEEGASATPAVETNTGGTLVAQPGAAPEGATGWNVYVGVSADSMTLQNTSLLAPGQSWTQPATLTTAGRKAGSGQAPSYLWPAPRLLQRG
jgi:hypothetical protein